MRALSLAAVLLIAVVMSASHPSLAADRSVPAPEQDRDQASIVAWAAQFERALLGVAYPGTGTQLLFTALLLPSGEETENRAVAAPAKEEDQAPVILEDGAPF